MIEKIHVRDVSLENYSAFAHLSGSVREFEEEAAALRSALSGRTVWMVNSTAQGGGVAEMLPMMVAMLRKVGIPTEWVVMGSDRPEFFRFTKRLHNLIHGSGEPTITADEREVYEQVTSENAKEFAKLVGPRDIVVVHDPQPAGMLKFMDPPADGCAIWRCHIGLDERIPPTRAAWAFLEPYVGRYDGAVFSAPEYIPGFLGGKSTIIQPALDPLSHKNRVLSTHKLAGVLCNAGLIPCYEPVLTPAFEHQAQRLTPNGDFISAVDNGDIGLVFRPTVVQISRWDRLKGFGPLLEAFIRLKRTTPERKDLSDRHRRRLELVRLILAGPDPASVADDPEAQEVLRELADTYAKLSPEIQKDVVLLSLPMASRKENALMVNALQLASTVLVQNSVREGFGLTATEGMWKAQPVLVSNACGLRHQVRDEIDGRVNHHPEKPEELASLLDEMLENANQRGEWGRSGQRRVLEEFLIFTQLRKWMRFMAETLEKVAASPAAEAGISPRV